MTFKTLVASSTAAIALATAAFAMNPTVGGAPMLEERNIIENAVNSPIHTTLVAAVQAADLVDTLQGEGPFTVFAPVNDAFAKLPAGTVETLLKPENKAMLQKVLTAHVVAGDWSAADIIAAAFIISTPCPGMLCPPRLLVATSSSSTKAAMRAKSPWPMWINPMV